MPDDLFPVRWAGRRAIVTFPAHIGVSNASQLSDQAIAAAVAPAYAFGVTYLLLRLIGLVMPLRATERQEALGMDVVQHGEEAYATGEGAILVSPESGVEAEVAVKPL